MIGWELRELRVRVTKNDKIPKSSQMRNKKKEKKAEQKKTMTNITQISPGEGLSEGLRGTHGELRELSEGLSEGLRGTQGRTQGLRGLRPPILENSGGNSGGTSPRLQLWPPHLYLPMQRGAPKLPPFSKDHLQNIECPVCAVTANMLAELLVNTLKLV